MRAAEEIRRQDVLLQRLSGLGLAVSPFPDGRGVAVTLPLGPERFELPRGGSARFESVSFATVGGDRIKCLKPLPFFHLPLIRVGGCATAQEFEARIRAAWRSRLLDLLRTRNWLEKLGLPAQPDPDDAPFYCLPLDLEDREAVARLHEPGRLVLPGRGPLSGLRLTQMEDRVFAPDPSLTSGVEVELAVSTRLEELARLHERRLRERPPPPMRDTRPLVDERDAYERRILLVGPELSRDRGLQESLRLRGYTPLLAQSERDALRTFDVCSPTLVLTEALLGRFEGIELIPELRTAAGVEDIPVVLVDAEGRTARREAAKRAGAAGYLVWPIQVERIAAGLESLLQHPRRRRFRRYPLQMAAHAAHAEGPDVLADIGRGGMFVWTMREVEPHTVDYWTVSLPEIGTTLGVTAEVVRLHTFPGSARRGLGLRFRAFDAGAEELLLQFLRAIESGAS